MTEVLQFLSPVTGQLLPMEQVADPIFSQKTMGEGYGVVPIDGKIVSPVSGVFMLIAETKHAIGIKTKEGIEVLIHMGIDTVDLNGIPFEINVSKGDEIQAGALLATVDLEKVKAAGKDTTIIVAITNTQTMVDIFGVKTSREAHAGETVATLTMKAIAETNSISTDGSLDKNQYAKTARMVLKAVGGKENINQLIHCITRLRFYLKDESIPQDEAIRKIPGVIDVARAGGQYQVVIGQTVEDVFNEAIAQLGEGFSSESETQSKVSFKDQHGLWAKTKFGASNLIGTITGSMMPVVGLLAASGMLKGILTILTTWGGVSTSSQTYVIISAMGDATFYFLPVLVGFTAAQKLGSNPVVVAIIGAFLIYPSLVQIYATGKFSSHILGMGINSNFLGIPIHIPQYTYSIFPMIFAAWMAAKLEPWIKSWMPVVLRMIFTPLVEIFLVGMTVLIVVGPIITLISTGISNGLQALLHLSLPLSGLIIGGFYQVLVIFGLHWAVIPIISAQLSVPGGHSVLNGIVSVTMIAQGAGALAVYVKTRHNENLKGLSASAAISAFCGITEPAMYGVNLKYGRVFITASIGAAIGGLVNGLLKVDMFGFTGSLIGFPSFASKTDPNNFLYFWIVSAITIVAAFTLTYLFGYKEEDGLHAKQAPEKRHLGQ